MLVDYKRDTSCYEPQRFYLQTKSPSFTSFINFSHSPQIDDIKMKDGARM